MSKTTEYALIGCLLALVAGLLLLVKSTWGIESAIREQTQRGILIQMKSLPEGKP